MNLNKTENTFVLGIFLALTGLLAALLLAYSARVTAAPIAAAAAENANKSLRAVLPHFKSQKTTVFNGITFTAVFDENGKFTGIAGAFNAKGYGGDITTLVGMNPDCTVRTVLITENNETPGLGSNVCTRKEHKTITSIFKSEKNSDALPPNRILDYYSGKSVKTNDAPWKITKDGGSCEYLTGATISSRAVCDAVYKIVSTCTANQEKILTQIENSNTAENK